MFNNRRLFENFRIFRRIDEKITTLKFLIRGIEYPARLASTGIHILLESLELAEQKGDAIIPPFQFSTEHTFQSDSTRRREEGWRQGKELDGVRERMWQDERREREKERFPYITRPD